MLTQLTKSEIQALKEALVVYCQTLGGGFAHVKWHKQCQYVEGWIAVFVKDAAGQPERRVAKMRLYSTGEGYLMTTEGHVVDTFFHG